MLVLVSVAAVCGNVPQGAEVDKQLSDTKTIAAFVVRLMIRYSASHDRPACRLPT